MAQPERIRILFVEDSLTDVKLEMRELKRAGLAIDHRVVERREDFTRELAEFRPDVILSDFSMPNFDGMSALAIAREMAPNIPFIFVSGTIGEEHAIRALRDGATDYVLKTNLIRLPSAIERALQQSRERAAQREMERALRASEERHRAMFEQAAVGIVHTSLDGNFQTVNPKICEMTGYTCTEMIQMSIKDLTHPDDIQAAVDSRSRRLLDAGGAYEMELRLLRKDRSEIWVHVTTTLIRDTNGQPSYFISVLDDISERKRAEHQLERFRMAMDVSPDSIYLTDPATMRFVYLNDTACQRLGYSRERLLQMGVHEVLPVGRKLLSSGYDEVIAAGDRGLVHESPFAQSDGTKGWAEIHSRALRTGEGTLIITIGRNITERKRADEQIRRLNRVYAVLSGINALIVRVQGRDELFREACRIAVEGGGFRIAWIGALDRKTMNLQPVAWQGFGGEHASKFNFNVGEDSPEEGTLVAQAVRDARPVISNDVKLDPRVLLKDEILAAGLRSAIVLPLLVSGEVVGTLTLIAAEAGFFDEEEVKLLTELAGDIAFAIDHIEKKEKLDYLAFYDQLTGLANRALFIERLNQTIRGTELTDGKFALAMLDIERLNTVNESLGRQAGDMLLKLVAERLKLAGGSNGVGRISADHFALIVGMVKGRSQATRVVNDALQKCFGKSFGVGGTELRISAKAGVALYPGGGNVAETLLLNAETALRKAKDLGERHVLYSSALSERTAGRLTLENQLRRALENDEFVLHYQPKVELEARRIVGVEALIRWQSPELGLVPPMKFIPLMEETGMILEAGAWALRRAAADHRSWAEMRLPALRVAVNVSAIQLRQREFVGAVEEAIFEGVAPAGIDLEITESLIMEDVEGNIEKLKAVRGLGVRIAIDDFGTGYSSLGYLAKLPVQTLKIDRSFIVAMLKDTDAMTLVSTIISLAHSLRLKVVAEGVETEEQAKTLRLLRCDEMQGYLFSKALPFEQMTALLTREGKAQ